MYDFFCGFSYGVGVVALVLMGFWTHSNENTIGDRDECAMEHNVFSCDWVEGYWAPNKGNNQ